MSETSTILTPLATPMEGLDSPQSLFAQSPRSPESRSQTEYFPIAATLSSRPVIRPSQSLHLAAVNSVTDFSASARAKPILLLVEDNNINMRLLETFVGKSKFEYDTAVNGLLALQAFQAAEKPYDIIFMDISMPIMNGLTSTRLIRQHERECRERIELNNDPHAHKHKPAMIIALTGLASAEAKQEALASGVDLFLTKPVRFGELRRILKDWVPG